MKLLYSFLNNSIAEPVNAPIPPIKENTCPKSVIFLKYGSEDTIERKVKIIHKRNITKLEKK